MSITMKRRLRCNAFRQIILNSKMLSEISNRMFHKLTYSQKIKLSREFSYLTREIMVNSLDRNPISEMKMRWLKIKIQTTLRLKTLTASSLLKKTLKVRKN